MEIIRDINRGIHLDQIAVKNMPLFVERIDRAISRAKYEFGPGAVESYLTAREEGYVPETESSHQIHIDLDGLVHVNHKLMSLENKARIKNPVKGFVATIATSVTTGHQGDLLSQGIAGLRPIAEELGTEIVDFTRKEDQVRYNLNPNDSSVTRFLINKVRQGYGLSAFPEGTVQAGRRLPREHTEPKEHPFRHGVENVIYKLQDWEILDHPVYGMQRFKGKDVMSLARIGASLNGKVAIIPVAIDGLYRIMEPTNDRKNRGTKLGYAAVLFQHPFGKITIRIGQTLRLDEVKADIEAAGLPFTDETLGDFVGREVAKLMPEKHRGYYADTV